MPNKLKRPCAIRSCPNLIDEGKYCDTHKQYKIHDSRRKNDSDRHRHEHTRRWQKLRLIYLRANPLCIECKKQNKIVPASEVHHIVPIARGGTDDESNLEALCKSCHSKKTAEENRCPGDSKIPTGLDL